MIVLKTQIWLFIKVAVARLFCTTTYRQAHWTRLSLLQVKFCSKGNSRLHSNRKGLPPTSIKPEPTHGANECIDLRISGQLVAPCTQDDKEENIISHFRLGETSLEFSKRSGDGCRFDQELRTGKDRTSQLLPCVTSRFGHSC